MAQRANGLEEVGILELLTHDDRPSFVSEIKSPEATAVELPQIVFRNTALDNFLLPRSRKDEFEKWATTWTVEDVNSRKQGSGRTWTCTRVGQRWLVIYCAQQLFEEEVRNAGQQLANGNTLAPASCQNEEGTNADNRRPSFSTAVTAVPRRSSSISAERLDWTQIPVTGLNEYKDMIKNYNWENTGIGHISTWPDDLRQIIVSIMCNPHPRILLWGEELTMVYNEAAAPLFGKEHPAAMGGRAQDVWWKFWPQFSPIIHRAVQEGHPTSYSEFPLFVERFGYMEEVYFEFTLLPIVSGFHGYGIGAVDEFTETTATVLARRRRNMNAKVAESILNVDSMTEAWTKFMQSLEAFPEDAPFALVYAIDCNNTTNSASAYESVSSTKYQLQDSVGLLPETPIPQFLDLEDLSPSDSTLPALCLKACHQTVVVHREDPDFPPSLKPANPKRGFGDDAKTICIMPVSMGVNNPLAFLILGLNTRRPFDDVALAYAQTLRDTINRVAISKTQKRFEEIAARSERRFTRMTETAPVGICSFAPDGRPIFTNNEYLNLINIPREEWAASKFAKDLWRDAIYDDDVKICEDFWYALTVRKEAVAMCEFRTKRCRKSYDKATGKEICEKTWLCAIASAEYDNDGKVAFIHGWLMDVSHVKRVETLQAQRLEDALETKRQSENFQDMIAHELRNPLSAILQSADWILSTLNDMSIEDQERRETILDSAQTIVLCAQHQKNIVDDVLTLSKLDSNLLLIVPDKVQPPRLIKKALRMFDAEMERANVASTLKIEPSYLSLLHDSESVMLDPSRLLQVIINLLTNAIKFTQSQPVRQITVSLGATQTRPLGLGDALTFIEPRPNRPDHPRPKKSEWGPGREVYLIFSVKDTGCGLTSEGVQMLFQRFSQASPKTYNKYGGSGLGLFISRELTELQGGQIGVCSEGMGKGSTFAFYIAARHYVPDAEGPKPGVDRPAISTMADAPVSFSKEGTKGLEMLPLKPRRLGSYSDASSATTSELLSNVVEQAQELPLHVLVVEDNLINQRVMAQQLRRLGCEVSVANHGGEALEFLRRTHFWSGQAAVPSSGPSTTTLLHPASAESAIEEATSASIPLSVILMDLEMPVMDGLTCITHIRNFEQSGDIKAHIPVIAVTANARSEQIAVAIQAGMDEVVTKPFRVVELVPQMRNLIRRLSVAVNKGEREPVLPSRTKTEEDAAG
ncbi:hypothetical protein M8818_004710 [Zalaria obscura]|uniref:Uncharacterized protein n=1 Tax=Zalaria obscura TaxID=2024903 RepID=A0ACC3SBX0_9PEZI